MSLVHKFWKSTLTTLLLLLTIQLTLQGFFRQKALLANKTPSNPHTAQNDRKVILMLVDALREDFVSFED
jgi:hypothetical protein